MRYVISVIWILSGLFLIFLGGETYWTYSTPNTFWLGMIPAFFANGHLWLGAHSFLVGLILLFKAQSGAKVYLTTFFLALVVFIMLMFVRELWIYGKWIANDYLKDELLLLLYVPLLIGSLKYFHFPHPDNYWSKDGALFDKQSAVVILVFIIFITAIPSIVAYSYLQFLH